MNERAGRMMRFGASLLAVVALVSVVPSGLLAAARRRFGSANPLVGVGWPWQWSVGDALDAVRSPLSDDAVVDLLVRVSVVIVWVAVAVIVATTAFEVAHLVRHRGMAMPSIRGLGWAQPIARTLAAGLVVLLPMTVPKATLADGGDVSPRTSSDTVERRFQIAPRGQSTSPTHSDPIASGSRSVPADRQTPSLHIVQRGESVYGIAETLAGDVSLTASEIADRILDVNLGMEMVGGQRFTNPAYIEVGWELVIPADVLPNARSTPAPRTTSASPSSPSSSTASTSPAPENPSSAGTTNESERAVVTHHLVERGDTLSGIAARHLGDPDAWPQIFDANAGRDMGDGRTFTDPHLIVPGWMIDIPLLGASSRDVPAAAEPTFVDHPDAHADHAATVHESPTATPSDVVDATTESANSTPTLSATTASDPTGVPTTTTTTTTPTTAPAIASGDTPAAQSDRPPAPDAPAPISVQHAALLAAGVLALVGVRRRQRLRSAAPRARVPEPPANVIATERRLRTVDPGERSTRVDVAIRAAAHELVDTEAQIGLVLLGPAGDIDIRLTAPARLSAPWQLSDDDQQSWNLPASVPVEILGESARRVGTPCIALVQLGISDGRDVLIDVEACGTLSIEADAEYADDVVTAVAAGLATSPYAEAAHLITVSLPDAAVLGHRNAHHAASLGAATDLATTLVGRALPDDRSTFSLRSVRTGGELWEPAIVLVASSDVRTLADLATPLPRPGRGIGLVVASDTDGITSAPVRLRGQSAGWTMTAFGHTLDLTPVGVTDHELAEIVEMVDDASAPLITDDPVWADDDAPRDGGLDAAPSRTEAIDPGTDIQTAADDSTAADDAGSAGAGDNESPAAIGSPVPAGGGETFEPRHHEIMVRLMGDVDVISSDGRPGAFERSKTVELIAWLATHRLSSTRSAARTALWELDVRDATFANVVSEARRGLGRLVTPPGDAEWVARTLTEHLPVHDAVVTDAELIEERLTAARLQPPAQAVETLRPAAALIRDMPFAGTSYLWPDAEGLTSNLVVLATGVAIELAAHALSLGDTDLVFWATGQGLKVLAGHEELIGLRMRAHARAGDLAGVRQEWESYERVIVADAWSDGEPAPKLLALRHQLLTSPT